MDDLFANTLSLSAHELATLVARLDHHEQRLDTLKAARKALKRSANHVPLLCQQPLFVALNDILGRDRRPAVLCEALWLLVDVIAGTPGLDSLLAPITPQVVAFLGHDSADVRRASLRVLHVQMRHTSNLAKSLAALIQFGIHSSDVTTQRGVIVALPLLFGDEFSKENLFALTDALARLLVRADNDLFYPVFLALQRLHAIVGKTVFRQYLESTDSEAKQLYESVLSRNPSADSDQMTLLERPLQSRRQDSEDYSPLLRFGLFPVGLILSAMNGSPDERLAAIEAVLAIIREAPLSKLAEMLSSMEVFVSELIGCELLEQNSFKVTLAALDIIEALVERLKSSMTPFVPTIVGVLAKRLGDGRTVIRDSVVKVIHHLMYSFPPQHLLDLLLAQKPSKNPKVREEIINRVTAAVLTFPRSEFNLAKLCFSVSPMLTDNRRMVRLAALECLAVLAQALGPHRLAPLLSAVEAIESTCQLDGLVPAVQARLARRALPRCAADGTVRYVLNPQQFSGWFSSVNEADLEWVMMASPSSHSGTPPKTLPLTVRKVSNGQLSGIPLANIPFDRRRSTHVHNPNLLSDESEAIEEMGRRKSMAETNIDKLLNSGQTADENGNGRSPLLERPALDTFRGVSFNSDDLDDRRDSEDSRSSSLEVWRAYFSRFRKQLAEVAFSELENEFKGQPLDARRSETDLPHFAQDMSESRAPSPQHSSSAPSTASVEHVVRFFHTPEQLMQVESEEAPCLERSLSLPSLSGQGAEGEEVADQEEEAMEKPSPFLATPLPTEAQVELREAQEPEVNDPEPKVNEPSSEPPALSVQEATPLHHRRSSSVTEPLVERAESVEKLDVWTQKDETLSSETSEDITGQAAVKKKAEPKGQRRKRAQPLGRQSRSQSPQGRRRPSRAPQQIYIKTTPAIAANANIRHILVNVAKTEGPFEAPHEAVKAAMMALQDDAWTTKVEGMLAVTRLASFHAPHLLRDQHQIVARLVQEVKNLRSTVSRSAIFTLGELFARLKTQIEPDMDAMVACLLAKSAENVVFMREDIERALTNALEEMPQTRTALALIHGGANHRNAWVRKTCAQFLALLVERMGAIKCLLGPRDLGEHLLPAAARFVQDPSPHTRFFGRKMFATLMSHVSFEKLLRKHVSPGTFRNIVGILESIKRRGVGDRPHDLSSPTQ